jgi:hypothetical protein
MGPEILGITEGIVAFLCSSRLALLGQTCGMNLVREEARRPLSTLWGE